MARPPSGTRCSRFAFVRLAGTVHAPAPGSISVHPAYRTLSIYRSVTADDSGSVDLPPRVVPHPMLVPAPVEGREGRASSGTRAMA